MKNFRLMERVDSLRRIKAVPKTATFYLHTVVMPGGTPQLVGVYLEGQNPDVVAKNWGATRYTGAPVNTPEWTSGTLAKHELPFLQSDETTTYGVPRNVQARS